MSLEKDGRFEWNEDRIYGGMRQDVTAAFRHYRILRNGSVIDHGSLIKDKGVRRLINAQITDHPTYGGYDARYANGSQVLFLFHNNGSAGEVHRFNEAVGGHTQADSSWTEEHANNAQTKPCVFMFADKLITIDGSRIRARNNAASWSAPVNDSSMDSTLKAALDRSTFGVVYANRMVVFGDPQNPHTFYSSDVRDPAVFDATNSVVVLEQSGEKITGASVIGNHLLVGGENFIRSYYLGTASPKDWDFETLSSSIGPINWQSFVPIARYTANQTVSHTFFWTKNGPMLAVANPKTAPSLVPLWEPLRRAFLGENYRTLEGFKISDYKNVEGAWCPEYNEVRFILSYKSPTARSVVLCINVDSAIAYASSSEGIYPMFRIRDNSDFTGGFPADTIFSCEVASSGAPSITGVHKTLVAKNGRVWELDNKTNCKDEGTGSSDTHAVKFQARMDGYDGSDDGVNAHEKSLRGVKVQVTAEGTYDLKCRVIGDGGQSTSTGSINIGEDLTLWGEGENWGTETLWASGEFNLEDIDLHALGRSFDVEFYDDGGIEAPFQINYWSLWGYLEDRR